METKKLLVSFLMFAFVLFLAASVSAAPVTSSVDVKVDGVSLYDASPALIAGDTITVKVELISAVNTSDVTVEAEIKVGSEKVSAETRPFDVETGQEYTKTLSLEVPFDLKDVLSDYATLSIDIGGKGYADNTLSFTLRVQRQTYNLNVLSVSVPQEISAGENFPVDFVLRNIGYKDLDDLFVTVKISALDLEKSVFFGDLVSLECDEELADDPVANWGVDIDRKCFEDKTDTANGRIFLQVPYDANPGVYALELEVENEDLVSSETVQVVIDNAFPNGHFIVSGDQLIVVNPTNQLMVYRLVPQSTGVISVSLSEDVVAVPAGSSRTVTVDATSSVSGTQTFDVSVFAVDGTLVDTISFSKNFEGRDVTSPIAVLTIVLAIIFIVLLIVLIVLIGKKPKKAEEFGESYY